MGRYVQNLIVRVINASEADTWENAVQEWEIVDCEEDEDLSESCVCGKKNSVTYLPFATSITEICYFLLAALASRSLAGTT